MNTDVAQELQHIARDAGVTAWVHAARLVGPPESRSLNSEEPVAMASLFKLPLALVWADLVDTGELAADHRLTLDSGTRTGGGTGVGMLLDDVSVTTRDAVRLMLAISDNACGDAVLALVGRERVQRRLTEIGLPLSLVRHGSAEQTRAVMRDTGASTSAAADHMLADPDRANETSQYLPALASSGTAAEIVDVLRILWSRDQPEHAMVRDALLHQPWRHRIGSGFPHDDVEIRAKTGTLGRLRHEAAVIQFPHEHPIAVSVLTRSARPERHLPRVDTAIGVLARTAVNPLRMSSL